MIAAGLGKGDRVGVWSPNRAEWVLTQYATAKAGVILVNINPAYRVHELEYALAQSGCRWVFSAEELKAADFVEMVREVRARVPTLERAIFFDTDEWTSLAERPADPDALARRMADLDFDDAINIQYTSGTTGFPKGATLTHHNILATMDDEGYMRVVGRIKDMVIRGGENVYPREIEEFLYTHPEIADVQVIGVPDERYGEELMAWVLTRPGASVTTDDVREFCRGQIAHYKIPRYVKFVDSFPMTVTGKVQKFKMRETAIDELGLAQAAAVATA